MKKLYIIIAFILISFEIFSQTTRIKFEHVSLEQGLSQSSVTSIVQDYKGFIWFATIDGLNKYDGYEMKTYYNIDKDGAITDNVLNYLYVTPEEENSELWIGTAGNGLCKYDKIKDLFISYSNDEKNSNSLSNNLINSIIGNNKVLWIATDDGLNKFEQLENKWTVFKNEKNENQISDNHINCLAQTKDGNIWIGTNNGLNFLDIKNNKFTNFFIKDGLLSNKITAISLDANNNLYIGTDKGFLVYNSENKIFKSYNIFNGLSDKNITSLLVDFEGIVWIGTRYGGLNRFDPKTEEFSFYIHEQADNNSLSINSILCLFQDKSDILWIGTSLGGVNKWNRAADNLLVFRHNPYDSYSLSSNQVRCIFEDSENNIWIGTIDGGLNEWKKEENKFIHFKNDVNNSNSLSNNHVRSILEDSVGNFWIATGGGGLNYFNRKTNSFTHFQHDDNNENSLSSDNIWKILIDNKKRFWIATHGGGLNLFDIKSKTFKAYKHSDSDTNTLTNDLITCMFIDSKNRFWIGTTKGLNQFFAETGFVKRYFNKKGDTTTLSNNRIYSVIEDSEGNIWIGTKGGLDKFISENETFKRFTTQTHDFPNNVMMGILEDNEKNLWISTNRGISKFNIHSETVRNYDIRDGLQSNEFLANSFLKTSDGTMFFGGINGFNAFNPENIKNNPHIPSIVITNFQVSNNFLDLDSAISEKKVIYLNHNQTDITFHFVALDYIFPEKNQYKYMLVGYDKDWVDAKFERYAKYTNLKPKKYIFKVKGSNNDEIWNDVGTQIVVVIKPAFWQTLIFKIGVALILIIISISIVWARIRILNNQKQKLEEQVKVRTKQLQESLTEIESKNNLLVKQKEEILQQNEILNQQKEEIEAQRDEIQLQKEAVELSRDHISEQKKEIEDSIHYAKRIQHAALPKADFLNKILSDYFILFKPRDIVSGDFYWASFIDEKLVIVAADCTGHGVPGAFMSMLGISFLDEIVNINRIIRPDLILNHLRDNIVKALQQTGEFFEAKDGMDISLCTIDYKKNIVQFSGANNPLYYIRNKELEIYKADTMPIAIYEVMNPFSLQEINIVKGDCFYLFSDGYADQFGGPKGKKFMSKKFKDVLIEISDIQMIEQKKFLDDTIEEWKAYPDSYGNKCFSQIDDIVVIGVRL